MDIMDQQIIRRLMVNSRESYHSIARAFDVTCPTITTRVNRLRQSGVIQRFIAEISQETLGVEWVLAEMRASKNVRFSKLLEDFSNNGCIGDVFVLGRNRFIVLAEVYPEERNDYISCLKKLDNIDYIEVSDIRPISCKSGNLGCKFTTRGEKVRFTEEEVELLKFLVQNARIPAKRISEITGYGEKLIRKILRRFFSSNGVHFTLKLNLLQSNSINLILKTRLRSMQVDYENVASWIAESYPEHHWFTLFSPRTDNLVNYLTVGQPPDIERIIRKVIRHPDIEEIDTGIVYRVYKSVGRSSDYISERRNMSPRPREIQVV